MLNKPLPLDIKEFTQDKLEKFLVERSFTSYASSQIFNWMYKQRVEDFSRMTNISKALRGKLEKQFYFSYPLLKAKKVSQDKTIKFLFKLKDGSLIETVLIPEVKRTTLCISTQVGCKFKCNFCASGISGFRRNLSCAEIVNQFLFVQDSIKPHTITNIVFMGVGEPLDNFENLTKAINIFMDSKGIYLGKRKICVSTCGLVPEIKKLADLRLGIKLSVSLHSAFDSVRTQLMPINKKYPLSQLIKALRYFIKVNNFPVTFEYVLIKDINSSPKDASKLASLARSIDCKMNLIVYNPSPYFDWQAPTKEKVGRFTEILKSKGVFFTLRKSRGADIEAACGQLRSQFFLK